MLPVLAGQYFEAESKLYYNWNRYYDPKTGRYTRHLPLRLHRGSEQAVFSTGVCDWSQPGVEQRRAVTNLTYEDGPGGKRLGRAPKSH